MLTAWERTGHIAMFNATYLGRHYHRVRGELWNLPLCAKLASAIP